MRGGNVNRVGGAVRVCFVLTENFACEGSEVT